MRRAEVRVGVSGAGSWTVAPHPPNRVRRRDAGEVESTIINRRNPELLGKLKDKFGFQKATPDWQDVMTVAPGEVPHISARPQA